VKTDEYFETFWSFGLRNSTQDVLGSSPDAHNPILRILRSAFQKVS
jgi:hypothetical protein